MAPVLLFTHEYPPYRGGIGGYARGLAEALDRRGTEVLVATPELAPLASPNTHIQFIRLPCLARMKATQLAEQAVTYRRLLKHFPHAHCHALDWRSWQILSLLNLFGRHPYSLTLHGSEIFSTASSIRAKVFGNASLFRNVNRISVNSRYTLDLLLQYFPESKAIQSQIAYPAPDEDLAKYANPASPATGKRLKILTVARIEPRKGYQLALDALERSHQQSGISFEWTIVGKAVSEDHYVKTLRFRAKHSPIQINFLENLSAQELAHQYMQSHIFLLTGKDAPGKVEGFGMVYIEAGLFGLPSVGTRTGGVGEAVLHESTGLLSKPDPDKIASNLNRLLQDPALRKRLGQRARERAHKFTWQATAISTFPELNDDKL